MKKTILTTLIGGLLLLPQFGCEKFLDVDPAYTQDADNYFNTPVDYQRALTGAYDLMQDERRKMERFLSGVPVTEVVVGNGPGQVSIRKLQKHLKKLPKKLNTVQLREVRARLKSVGGLNLPMPKGPMPTNLKMPRR